MPYLTRYFVRNVMKFSVSFNVYKHYTSQQTMLRSVAKAPKRINGATGPRKSQNHKTIFYRRISEGFQKNVKSANAYT